MAYHTAPMRLKQRENKREPEQDDLLAEVSGEYSPLSCRGGSWPKSGGSWPKTSKRRTGQGMSLWELSEALAAPTPAAPPPDFAPLELGDLDGLCDDLDALDALVGEESESSVVSTELADDDFSRAFRLAFESAEPTSSIDALEAELLAHQPLEAQLEKLGRDDGHADDDLLYLVEHHPGSPASAMSSEPSSDDSLEHELGLHPGLDHEDLLDLLHPHSPMSPDDSPDSPVSITALAIGGAESLIAAPRERSDSSGASSGGALLAPSPPSAGGVLKLERKEWTYAEDQIILSCVSAHGCRWRKIAAQLPGRSDDAVRNRYARLKGDAKGGAAAGAAVCTASPELTLGSGCDGGMPDGVVGQQQSFGAQLAHGGAAQRAPCKPRTTSADGSVGKPERVSWTRVEDETILRCVLEWGNKWGKISACLPGRTEHAIRNRFARLQAIYAAQEQQAPVAAS